MKQIKTVIKPINAAAEFDKEVSELLKAGWIMNRRATINIHGELSDSFNISTICALYAELEYWEPIFEEVTL